MAEAFRKDNLEYKIAEKGIILDDNIKWTNDKLVKILGDYTMEHSGKNYTWGQKYLQSMETLMLCKHYKDEMKHFKTSPFEMDEFIAEEKKNGMRCFISVDPFEGITILSRPVSVATFLNGEFTDKVLFVKDGIISKPSDYKGKFKDRFIIEGEITINTDSNNRIFDGVEYSSIEDFIQAILGSNAERAIKFQKDGHELKFTIFDVLYFEPNATEQPYEYKFQYKDKVLSKEDIAWIEDTFRDYLETTDNIMSKKAKNPSLLYQYLITLKDVPKWDVRRLPFHKRRQLRGSIVKCLQQAGIPMNEVDGEDTYKASYLDQLLREGKEGIILKHRYAPYISAMKSSRSHRAEMKVKQTITSMLENAERVEDFDVFITGANPPKSERIKDMIGSLKCSIYVIDEFGETKEHEIANVTGINHEWKRKLAKVDEVTGEISLNPEYLNKVIPIDGLALSATNLKFQHAVLKDRGNIEFKPKHPTDCVWNKEDLELLVITRGD